MAFTDLATVRKHLVAASVPSQTYENSPVTLTGTTPQYLPHAHLLSNSVIVKWLASDKPERENAVLLINEDDSSLAHKNVVRNSVTVAADLALSQVFSEELDYRMNHRLGRIRRLAGGNISNSFPVVVWYHYYELFDETTDFIVDHSAGSVRRTTGSAIPDGANVLVDYTISQGSAEDVLIDQAIVEAQDIIVRGLRDGYTAASTDQGLKTGANYLALSIVSRGMSALMLTRNVGSDAYSRAREWQQLSDKWFGAAWNVLAPFVDPHSLRSIVVE